VVVTSKPVQTMPTDVCPFPARFRPDLEAMIEGHAVVNKQPATIWQDGLFLGNGDIASMVWGQPWRTRILLNKSDIWDERDAELEKIPSPFNWRELKDALVKAIEEGDFSAIHEVDRKIEEAWKKTPFKGAVNASAYHAAGYLDILGDFPGGVEDFSQRMSLYRGKVETNFSHKGKKHGFTTYCHADKNLIVADLWTEDGNAWPRSFVLHRKLDLFRQAWAPYPHIGDPSFGHDEDTLWMTFVMPDGLAFAVLVQVDGARLETYKVGGQMVADVIGAASKKLQVRTTIVTGRESPGTLIDKGKAQLVKMSKGKTAAKQLASHEKWWEEFWRTSWISLPDKMLENLWYIELYKMASCSREGGLPPGQLAHWNGFHDAPWRGDYHMNINIQENYWPVYTAGHPELGIPLADLYLNTLEYTIADTKKHTGQPGARFVRGHGPSGRPNGRGQDWELWPGAGPWICCEFWWHYQVTRDVDFLRKMYPVFTASLEYFVAFLGEPDKNGRYNIVPSVAHEQRHEKYRPTGKMGEWGRNSTYDLGILRDHLRNTIRASEILRVDAGRRELWKRIYENTAPYPVSPNGYFQEWEGIELDNSHRHLNNLYPVYPGDEVHAGITGPLEEAGSKTVSRMIQRGSDAYTGFSFGWVAAAAARMGMAQEALGQLHDHVRGFVNINGYSLFGASQTPGLAPYSGNRGSDWKGKLPNCESGGSFCAGINELLLNSPGGTLTHESIIRVFPAVVRDWANVQFSRLRAEGAFLVSADRRGSFTRYAVIESLVGAPCAVYNPFHKDTVVVRRADNSIAEHTVRDGVIRFETKPGEAYVLFLNGSDPASLPMLHLKGDETYQHRLGVGGFLDTSRASYAGGTVAQGLPTA